ncbi:MAG: alpha/beta hydrolase [Sphingomonadales bacterium]|nr:alpha/beta hydrolase [Sphingomonadales bacterium]
MTDYVLVHGAWGGSFGYDRVAGELRAAGHRVVLAQLTGLGTRKGEFHPGITLTTHIDDVCNQIASVGFDKFVLVGHSYGGMIMTGVATRLGGRIKALVYLDAFLPQDGQSLWDLTGDFEHNHYIGSQKFTPGAVAPLPGLESPVLTPHPLLTLLEAVKFTGEEARVGRRIYVFANAWEPTPFRKFVKRVTSEPGWEYHEAKASHNVMGDQPEQTLAILLGCA